MDKKLDLALRRFVANNPRLSALILFAVAPAIMLCLVLDDNKSEYFSYLRAFYKQWPNSIYEFAQTEKARDKEAGE